MVGRVIGEFKKNLSQERAKLGLKDEAKSHARMIKQARDIPQVLAKMTPGEGLSTPPRPTGVGVRMLDGKPMHFFTDGSMRHAAGRRVTKAARKALKRAKHANAKKSA